MRATGVVAADLYCSRGDVNERVPGGITYEGRLVHAVNVSSDSITLDGHGFEDGIAVTVRAFESGSLPGGLVDGSTYYVKRLTNAKFQLSATDGGAAIDLTTAGESIFVAREPPYDNVIEFVSRWVDSFFDAHVVPFAAPIHPLVRGITADISAKRLQNYDGKLSGAIDALEDKSAKRLEAYASDLDAQLRAASGVTTSVFGNRAIVASVTDSARDQRGWGSGTIP